MNNIEQEIYLELLRASLWEREVDTSLFKGEWCWKALLDAYTKNDLLGVVANTILTLPENIKPQMQDIVVVYNYLGNLLQNHNKLNRRLADIMPRLESAGCHPVLLKGQGLSVLYPKSCIRSCGDLDIYVGIDGIENAKEAVNSIATKEELKNASDHSAHHYNIDLNGVSCEIHRAPGHTPYNRRTNTYLSLSNKFLQPDRYEIVSLSVNNDEKTKVHVPSIDFNVWYVFVHLVQHFSEKGVGLRQFCDWMMVIREFNKRGTLEQEKLKDILIKIGLLHAWKVLGGILVYQLGLPKGEFPFFDEQLAKESQGFVLKEIMDGSRFHFSSLDSLGDKGSGIEKTLYYLRSSYYSSRQNFVISPWLPVLSFCKLLTTDAFLAARLRIGRFLCR